MEIEFEKTNSNANTDINQRNTIIKDDCLRLGKKLFENVSNTFFLSNIHKLSRSEVVDHFVKKGIARQTIHSTLNRRKNGQLLLGESPFITDVFYEESRKGVIY